MKSLKSNLRNKGKNHEIDSQISTPAGRRDPTQLTSAVSLCRQTVAGHLRSAFAARPLLLLLLLALPAAVQAQFTYTTKNGAITITGYDCSSGGGAVTIPSTINGLPVTSIGDNAFNSCTSLTSVTIGNNVTSIGDWAFYNCTSLTSVTIPNSVTRIGYYAFSHCTSLIAMTVEALNSFYCSVDGVLFDKSQTTLIQYPGGKAGSYTIPNSVTSIGYRAFYGCTSLTSVTIPNSVTTIWNEAFSGCTSLISVTIPNSVTSIWDRAFYGCTSLTSVTIGNSVTSIGGDTFNGCTSLTSVTIPNSVTSIAGGPFEGCTSLSAITVEALNSFYSSVDGVLFDQSQTTLIEYPGGKAGSYTIPNSVTRIGGEAFDGCTSLTSVTIPNSVTSIGWLAFYGCTSLTGVYFEGNSPSFEFAWLSANNATVYYLPGTTGWGPTLDGPRPAVLWNPQAQTSGSSFGVRTNQFGFTITGSSGLVIVVEACTNLVDPVWTSVGTNTLTGGSSYFSDPQWTNYPACIYRLRAP